MAFIIEELFRDRQLDFSVDPELLCDLLDQMSSDGEIIISYEDTNSDLNEPVIKISDFPAILEKLKFTLIPEIKHDTLKISLFAPQPIRMEMNYKKENQPHVASSSSG